MANIFAFAESRNGKARKVALETTTAARALADSTGGEVHALVAGAAGISGEAAALGSHGADVIHVAENPGFEKYNAEALAELCASQIKAGGYRIAVFSTSAQGRDLAPRVAAKLGVGIVTDVTEFKLDGDNVTVKHPINIGKVIATIRIKSTPAVFAIRAGAVTPVQNAKAGKVEQIQASGDPGASRVKVTEMVEGGSGKLDLAEAPVVIAGGRGLKAAENFKLVEDLAAAFGNAAVGATRAVTDDGWRPHSDQIGQTGRLVSPDLYIAVGISGAVQHLAGMRTSRTIVAINKDKDAPIFKVADYGIVGDVFEILPVLTEAIREARKSH